MRLDEVKAICRDFTPIKGEDGKTTCCNKIVGKGDHDDVLCYHPAHFTCDVAAKAKFGKVSAKTSVSRVQKWMKCQRAWALHYYYRVKPITPEPMPLTAGKLWSVIRAKIDAGMEWSFPDDFPTIERWRLGLVIAEYQRLKDVYEDLKRPYHNEVEVVRGMMTSQGPTDEVRVVGYLDFLTDDRKVIGEWKYTTEPDSYDILKVNLQACSYFASVPEAEEFHLYTARRVEQEQLLATPVEKRKYTKATKTEPARLYAAQREADEDVEEWTKRVQNAQGAAPLIKRRVFKRDEFDVENVIRIFPATELQWREAMRVGRFWPNESACGWCEWQSWCRSHPKGACKDDNCPHLFTCTRVKVTDEERESFRRKLPADVDPFAP